VAAPREAGSQQLGIGSSGVVEDQQRAVEHDAILAQLLRHHRQLGKAASASAMPATWSRRLPCSQKAIARAPGHQRLEEVARGSSKAASTTVACIGEMREGRRRAGESLLAGPGAKLLSRHANG
jgi:hypothetical protein